MIEDAFNLERFVSAQATDYERALAEIRAGRKRSHWMWYIFPQIDGLGTSPMARQYAIRSLEEARAYLAHPILGPRLLTVAEAALTLEESSPTAIFGTPDDMKLRSCATLFAATGIDPEASVFNRLLARFFRGEGDEQTRAILAERGTSAK